MSVPEAKVARIRFAQLGIVVRPVPAAVGIALVCAAAFIVAPARGWPAAISIGSLLLLMLFPMVAFASRNSRQRLTALLAAAFWTVALVLVALFGPLVMTDILRRLH